LTDGVLSFRPRASVVNLSTDPSSSVEEPLNGDVRRASRAAGRGTGNQPGRPRPRCWRLPIKPRWMYAHPSMTGHRLVGRRSRMTGELRYMRWTAAVVAVACCGLGGLLWYDVGYTRGVLYTAHESAMVENVSLHSSCYSNCIRSLREMVMSRVANDLSDVHSTNATAGGQMTLQAR